MSLYNRIWWTKKSRIKAEKRLLNKDFLSQCILFWYSFFLVFASIFELTEQSKNPLFSTLMVSLSVLVLGVTLFIGSRNFKERAMLIKQCYEQLSILNTKAKNLEGKPIELEELENEYQKVLSVCENHSEIDFKCAVLFEFLNTEKSNRTQLTKKPNPYSCFVIFNYYVFYWIVAIALFFLPILIWYVMR